MYHFAQETADDWWEVEALYDLAFAPGREALSSYRLRDGIGAIQAFSRIARDDDGILSGAIRYWPVRVGATPALLLGPVAVHPTRQGEGLGGALIRESLASPGARDWQRVLLVGDAPYYQRFGFRRLEHVAFPPPTNPARVLGLDLIPSAWQGVGGPVGRFAD